jgi:hypothetical protein
MFKLAELAASNGDERTQNSIYKALEQDPNPDIRAEARFRMGMRLANLDRTREAALLFRRVLDDKPHATSARLQLALMLERLGDKEAALREIRAVQAADLPLTVAQIVDGLAASLQAKKPFGVQLELAIAPDSNVNHATRSDTLGTVLGDFKLDPGSKARSGVGAAFRGLAHGRMMLSQRLTVVSRASADLNLYRDSEFNGIALDLAVAPELSLNRVRLSSEAGVTHQWYGMRPYQRSFRVGLGGVAAVGRTTQLRLNGSSRKVFNRLNSLQNGRGLTGRLRLERALSPRMMISASLTGDRFKSKDPAYSTRSWQAGAAMYREVGRMTLSVSGEIGRLAADERLQLLPEARSDLNRRVAIGSVFRSFSIGGFAPMSRLVFEQNRSNIELYDYRRVRTEFGITRAF